jgi:hypothetical protein
MTTEAFPIKEQNGLSKEDLSNMQPVEQTFAKLSKIPMIAQSGVSTQKSNLANNIRKSIVDYFQAKEKADMVKDPKAMDKCIKNFADDLANLFAEVISAQAITVTTNVNTVVVGSATPAGVVSGTGTGTGTALPNQVTSK